eukprot:jgi/Ulvmu1/8858/UM049_0040.1
MVVATADTVTQHLQKHETFYTDILQGPFAELKMKHGTLYRMQLSGADLEHGISFPLRTSADEWYIPKIKTFVAYNDKSQSFLVQDGDPLSLTRPNPSLRPLIRFAGITEDSRSEKDLEFWVALHTDDVGVTREVVS